MQSMDRPVLNEYQSKINFPWNHIGLIKCGVCVLLSHQLKKGIVKSLT